jgi:hypothetical protein
MTSLVAWVGADSRGPSSLNIAADSRITWGAGTSVSYHWDQGKKVFASSSVPLVIGFVGDVLFPALVLPGVIDRIDRGVFRPDGSVVEGVIAALRRGWRDYPPAERRDVNVYVAYRTGEGMSCRFRLTSLSHRSGASADWAARDIPVPSCSAFLKIDGSGKTAVKTALDAWQATSAADTSRAVFSGFVDAVTGRVDPDSGGAPQLGCIYRTGPGRLLGIIHDSQRYFAGAHLIGDEALDGIEWGNALFERADGHTKQRLPGAQPQPRPTKRAEHSD